MNLRIWGLTALVGATLAVSAATPAPGKVGTDFAAACAAAEAGNIPLAVVWGNTNCPNCNKMSEVLECRAVAGWLAKHPILVVHKHEAYGSQSADYLAAKEWILGIRKLNAYPFVGLFWKKSDGTVVQTAFSGLSGKMPVTTPRNDLAAQFVNTLDSLFGSYAGSGGRPSVDPPASGDVTADAAFVAGETAGDRLEATSATRTVYVPLRRTTAGTAATCELVAVAPGSGEEQRVRVSWRVGETRVNVPVEMPKRMFVGRKMSLRLLGADGAVRAMSSITFVSEPENAADNPHAVGAHTARTLPYGEWTMDFDVAREKVATQGGHLVAMFAGPLWCPNCTALDESVLNTRNFRTWAKREKVVLVLFDQGQASTPSTPEGTATGRLLSHEPSRTGRSGSAWMARKGLDSLSDSVAETIRRTADLTARWLPAGSTAARLSNPTLLLLDREGTRVQARFVRQRDGVELDLQENLARLADLIDLEGSDDDWTNGSTTPLELAPGGHETVTFHVNRRTVAWRLDGLTADDRVQARVTSDDRKARDVDLALALVEDGVTVATLATERNRLLTEKPLAELIPETVGDGAVLCLTATAFGTDSEVSAQRYGRNCAFAATVSLRAVAGAETLPEDIASFSRGELVDLNPKLAARQSATVPLYAEAEGGRRLVGLASVSAATSRRVTVKVAGETSASFSGQWQEINPVSGTVGAALTDKGRSLAVTMDAAGAFTVTLDGDVRGTAATLAQPAAFAGAYTVTLVPESPDEGVARLMVKVSRTGRATVSGLAGRGARISTSAALVAHEDGSATLPIYRTTAAGTLAAALRIAPNAAATWGNVGEMATVGTADDCRATWTDRDGAALGYEVYGGYWMAGTSPLAACELFDLPTELDVTLGGEALATVTATKSGFAYTRGVLKSLSVARSTGALNGKVSVQVDGRTVTATIAGVLLPGWHDCGCTAEPVVERPFASGMASCTIGGVPYVWPVHVTHREE